MASKIKGLQKKFESNSGQILKCFHIWEVQFINISYQTLYRFMYVSSIQMIV